MDFWARVLFTAPCGTSLSGTPLAEPRPKRAHLAGLGSEEAGGVQPKNSVLTFLRTALLSWLGR